MAKTLSFKPRTFSDAEVVAGFLDDTSIQEYFYKKWSQYFMDNYRAIFFQMSEESCRELIQESFIVLWTKISIKMVRVVDGQVVGKNDKPFTASLTTYLMNVAKLKKKENLRSGQDIILIDDLGLPEKGSGQLIDILNLPGSLPWEDAGPDYQYEAMMQAIGMISERCQQILTAFYFQEMKLDAILSQFPSFQSKDALKTAKNKCINRLRTTTMDCYQSMLRFA